MSGAAGNGSKPAVPELTVIFPLRELLSDDGETLEARLPEEFVAAADVGIVLPVAELELTRARPAAGRSPARSRVPAAPSPGP